MSNIVQCESVEFGKTCSRRFVRSGAWHAQGLCAGVAFRTPVVRFRRRDGGTMLASNLLVYRSEHQLV